MCLSYFTSQYSSCNVTIARQNACMCVHVSFCWRQERDHQQTDRKNTQKINSSSMWVEGNERRQRSIALSWLRKSAWLSVYFLVSNLTMTSVRILTADFLCFWKSSNFEQKIFLRTSWRIASFCPFYLLILITVNFCAPLVFLRESSHSNPKMHKQMRNNHKCKTWENKTKAGQTCCVV